MLALDQSVAVLLAALGASALTILGTMAIEVQRARHGRRAARDEARLRAYADVLTRSGLVGFTAESFRLTMQFRSGLGDAIEVATRMRGPIEPFDLDDRLRRDLEPMWLSMAQVSILGSPAAMIAADDLAKAVGALLHESTRRGEDGSGARRFVRGDRWTAEQLDALEARRLDVVDARRRLTDVARAEFGSQRFDWATEDGVS